MGVLMLAALELVSGRTRRCEGSGSELVRYHQAKTARTEDASLAESYGNKGKPHSLVRAACWLDKGDTDAQKLIFWIVPHFIGRSREY